MAEEQIKRLVGLPILHVHGSKDWMFPVRFARTAASKAGKILGEAGWKFVELQDWTHASPSGVNEEVRAICPHVCAKAKGHSLHPAASLSLLSRSRSLLDFFVLCFSPSLQVIYPFLSELPRGDWDGDVDGILGRLAPKLAEEAVRSFWTPEPVPFEGDG